MTMPFRVNRLLLAIGVMLLVGGLGVIGLAKEQQDAAHPKLRWKPWEGHEDYGVSSRTIYLAGIATTMCGAGTLVTSIKEEPKP